MLCPFCKEDIQDGAVKCKHCGSMLHETVPEIKSELQAYEKHMEVKCPECNYSGKMGIIGKKVPWYVSLWMIIPLLLIGFFDKRTFFSFLVFFFLRHQFTKYQVVCPQCKNNLICDTD